MIMKSNYTKEELSTGSKFLKVRILKLIPLHSVNVWYRQGCKTWTGGLKKDGIPLIEFKRGTLEELLAIILVNTEALYGKGEDPPTRRWGR